MGIEGVEELTSDQPSSSPLPDDEAIEEQKREEEGIEPSEPVELPTDYPPSNPEE